MFPKPSFKLCVYFLFGIVFVVGPSYFIPFGGNNVFHVNHPGHQALRVKVKLYVELLQDPYFRDRVAGRPSIDEVINAKALTRHYLSREQVDFLKGLDDCLNCARQDPIRIQRASDHKIFLLDPDYPGHKGHPEHSKWLKQVKMNLKKGKV